jgi:hypothetical protein
MTAMSATYTTQAEWRLATAQDALVRATLRLRRAQNEALLGMRYDDEELDRLIAEARRARREADAAWSAWQSTLLAGRFAPPVPSGPSVPPAARAAAQPAHAA